MVLSPWALVTVGGAILTTFPLTISTALLLDDEDRKAMTVPSNMSKQSSNDSIRWFKEGTSDWTLQENWIMKDLNVVFSIAPRRRIGGVLYTCRYQHSRITTFSCTNFGTKNGSSYV
jgi:hypothetical protein